MKRVLHIVFAITLGGLIPAAPVLADMTTLNYDVIATAEDFGPKDGTYDAFAPFNLGSVNNNGYGSFRTAFEFDLSSLPSGAKIESAQLNMTLSNPEGARTIEVHGYSGSGTVQLVDFHATKVDPETVRLADATVKMVGKGGKLLCHTEDVDGDGLTDRICQVVVSEMAVALGSTDTQATLRAQTVDGAAIAGSDSINIVKDCSY